MIPSSLFEWWFRWEWIVCFIACFVCSNVLFYFEIENTAQAEKVGGRKETIRVQNLFTFVVFECTHFDLVTYMSFLCVSEVQQLFNILQCLYLMIIQAVKSFQKRHQKDPLRKELLLEKIVKIIKLCIFVVIDLRKTSWAHVCSIWNSTSIKWAVLQPSGLGL